MQVAKKTSPACWKSSPLATYTAEILIEQFDISVNDLQGQQLVVVCFHAAAEIQARVPETRVSVRERVVFGSRDPELGARWKLD